MTLCYVTGAGGFFGQNVCEALLAAGDEVVAVSRGKSVPQGCKALKLEEYGDLKAESGSVCVHLAETNVISEVGEAQRIRNTAVLKKLLAQPFKKIVYASSAAIYPDTSQNAHSEDEEISEISIRAEYQRSKLEAESILLTDAKRAHCVLRLGNLYGVGMSEKSLIRTVVSQLSVDATVTVRTLKPIRDYISVTDAAAALVRAVHSATGGVFNIGSGEAHSVSDVIRLIAAASGEREPSIHALEDETPASCIKLNISKARKELGWDPALTFRDGIQEYLKNEQ